MPDPVPHQTQLIVYPDGLGGSLQGLNAALQGPLRNVCPGGVHLLPPFPSSGDRGFAPLTYDTIEPAFGGWSDVEQLGSLAPLTVDVMVNHVSRHSEYFIDFQRRGRDSTWADCFVTLDKVFPDGTPTPEQVEPIFLRKPSHPFLTVTAGGAEERIWTTFGPRVDHAEQIDLDVTSPRTQALIGSWLAGLAAHGIAQVRLDAVGYVTKEAGTACFMNEPAIWPLLDRLVELAATNGLAALPEIHAGVTMHRRLAERGYLSYDFALPGLILHALISGSAATLGHHLRASPARQVTMLDCHDGIPMHPDLDEVLSADEIQAVVDTCLGRGANVNRVLKGSDRPSTPPPAHQINCTYRSAAGSDRAYLVARAIHLFAPGTPQIYYVGLLAGLNAPRLPDGDGREVNRQNFTASDILSALDRDVVRRQLALIDHRNTHPAFLGTLAVSDTGGNLTMVWSHREHWTRLDVDVTSLEAEVSHTTSSGTVSTLELDLPAGSAEHRSAGLP